jgi:plastocyanin
MRSGAALLGTALLAAATASAAETIRVSMDRLSFTPAEITAHVGDTIEWVNKDFLAHSATARSKTWDVMVMPNKTGRVTLKEAGSIDYFCRFHPNMTGHISVAP